MAAPTAYVDAIGPYGICRGRCPQRPVNIGVDDMIAFEELIQTLTPYQAKLEEMGASL
jgi:hypothetical protein